MTLEQAIEHAERAYKESRNGLQYALKRGETKFAERCKKDAEEYVQLAEWLSELQERRKIDNEIPFGDSYSFTELDSIINAYEAHGGILQGSCRTTEGIAGKTQTVGDNPL